MGLHVQFTKRLTANVVDLQAIACAPGELFSVNSLMGSIEASCSCAAREGEILRN